MKVAAVAVVAADLSIANPLVVPVEEEYVLFSLRTVITVGSIPSPRVNTYTSGGMRYHVILGNNGTTSASGTVLSGTVNLSQLVDVNCPPKVW